MQVSNSSNITVRPVQAAANNAPLTPAPALVGKAKAEGDSGSGFEKVGGIAKKIMEDAAKVGGDIKKLPWWEKLLVATVGAIAGWKMDQWVRDYMEKKQGEEYNTYGQDQYLSLAKSGDGALVEAMSKKHTFISDTLTDGDFNRSEWRAFQTFAVLQETTRPTIGTYEGHANMPVALIALAKNPTSDKTALTALSVSLKRQITGAPAKQEFYQPVIDALKSVHNISVL
jgi:hypothetical protein